MRIPNQRIVFLGLDRKRVLNEKNFKNLNFRKKLENQENQAIKVWLPKHFTMVN